MVEEFGPTIQYIKGTHNIVADALSHLSTLPPNTSEELFASIQYDPDDFSVSFSIISNYQEKDTALQSSLLETPSKYEARKMHNSSVIPEKLQGRIIQFYHDNLKHPGVTQTLQIIQQFMVWTICRLLLRNMSMNVTFVRGSNAPPRNMACCLQNFR